MDKEAIDALLQRSSLDEETREYVSALILDGEEEDDLSDTLSSFLCEDGDAAIVTQLLALVRPREKQEEEPEPLRRLEQAVTISAGPPPPTMPPTPALMAAEQAPAKLQKHPTKAASKPALVPPAASAAQLFGTDDYGSAQHSALDELDDLECVRAPATATARVGG